MEPFTLFAGHVHTTGSTPDGRQIGFWYQTTPHDLAAVSQYLGILAAHAFTMSRPLRPDIVLRWTDPDGGQRWLLIECKLITSQYRAVNSAARQALADLLQYRSDFDVAFGTTRAPYGLGVAWGEGLQPNLNSDIVLCTPDTLDHAIRHITTGGLPARSFTRLTWWRSRRVRSSSSEVSVLTSGPRPGSGTGEFATGLLLGGHRVEFGLQLVPCRRDGILRGEERNGAFELAAVVAQLVGRQRPEGVLGLFY